MDINTIIIDNFLDNPDTVRKSVLEIDFSNTGSYPGFRSNRADEDYQGYIQEKIEKIMNKKILEFGGDSLQFQLCLEGDSTWIHYDESEWAGVLYLTPNAPVMSGTGIYRHISTNDFIGKKGIDNKISEDFELITLIGNVYNRLVLYKGSLWHRSYIPGFGTSKETGRLFQVFFFNIADK